MRTAGGEDARLRGTVDGCPPAVSFRAAASAARSGWMLAGLLAIQPAILFALPRQTAHPAPMHTSPPMHASPPRQTSPGPMRAPTQSPHPQLPAQMPSAPQSRLPSGPAYGASAAGGRSYQPSFQGGRQNGSYQGGMQNGPPSRPPRPLITAHPAPGMTPMTSQQPQNGRARTAYPARPAYGGSNPQTGQHLPSWLANHQGESLLQQQQSLRQERGFNRLPAPQQQRLMNRLQQLDSMPPQQRQRTLSRVENMERLSPEKRQAVRSAAQQMGRLAPDRQQSMRQAFRELRDVPPGERQQLLNSPAYRSRFNDSERGMLGNLLSVEPYQPR